MPDKKIKNLIGQTFLDISEGLKTGSFGKKIKVGLTTAGSELGVENMVRGAEESVMQNPGFDVVLIGPKCETDLELIEVEGEQEAHKKMEELLDSGYISACATMHYSFPIGVSTVGRVVTPGRGESMFLATTTGTSSPHRTEAMVLNALGGIVTAKAMGIKDPSVGILNLDGARQTERALRELSDAGYKINFGESFRADGGTVMRGNDLLRGSSDIMVTDTLTGNVMMKVFSSFTTGGDYESAGFGYGPGVGANMERVVLILSRASGVPVIANALKYAARLAKGNLLGIAKEEYKKAKAAGLDKILEGTRPTAKPASAGEGPVTAPPKEIVTGEISGIDILELEDAVEAIWRGGIYAESGMGCTGPVVMVADDKIEKATELLVKAGFVAGDGKGC